MCFALSLHFPASQECANRSFLRRNPKRQNQKIQANLKSWVWGIRYFCMKRRMFQTMWSLGRPQDAYWSRGQTWVVSLRFWEQQRYLSFSLKLEVTYLLRPIQARWLTGSLHGLARKTKFSPIKALSSSNSKRLTKSYSKQRRSPWWLSTS